MVSAPAPGVPAAQRSTALGTGLATTSVASVQFGAALAAHLFPRVGPLGAVSLRMLAASVVLTLLTRPWRRDWTRADLCAAAAFGAVFTLMNVSLYLAIERLPLATVITLEFLGPLTIAVVTAADRSTRAWAAPAAAGVVLLGGSLDGGDVLGVLFALTAACCWAGYILLSGRIGRTGSGLAGLSVGCTCGAVVMVPIGAVSAGSALVHPSTLALGLVVGVLSSAIPYSLDLVALRRLPTAAFGVLTSLNPGVAALAGRLVLGETLPARGLLGVALVMLASVGVTASQISADPRWQGRRRARSTRRQPVPDRPAAVGGVSRSRR